MSPDLPALYPQKKTRPSQGGGKKEKEEDVEGNFNGNNDLFFVPTLMAPDAITSSSAPRRVALNFDVLRERPLTYQSSNREGISAAGC